MASIETQIANAQAAVDRLRFADSYSRMQALLELRRFVPSAYFWKELGLNWDCCDNIYLFKSELLRPFEEHRQAKGLPITEAMNEADSEHYDALPQRVTLFRGCYAHNKNGLSWSTSGDVGAGSRPSCRRCSRARSARKQRACDGPCSA